MKKWPEEHIILDGIDHVASAPYIISASRATDIPGFYSSEFSSWLKRGWCWSINPFNGVKTRISFSNCKVIVFWSKNPLPLFRYLPEISQKYRILFQFTLNDYEKEKIEKNVPSLQERINTFIELADIIGKKNLLWRFDPILLSETIKAEDIVKRICAVGDRIHTCTERLIFSFIKISRYKRVSAHIRESKTGIRELTEDEKNLILAEISSYNDKNWGLQITSCGTPDVYQNFRIETTGCISYEHIRSLGIADFDFNSFYEYDTPGLFDVDVPKSILAQGQQPLCNCIQSKDVGRYNTCAHGCVYCYANRAIELKKQSDLE